MFVSLCFLISLLLNRFNHHLNIASVLNFFFFVHLAHVYKSASMCMNACTCKSKQEKERERQREINKIGLSRQTNFKYFSSCV